MKPTIHDWRWTLSPGANPILRRILSNPWQWHYNGLTPAQQNTIEAMIAPKDPDANPN